MDESVIVVDEQRVVVLAFGELDQVLAEVGLGVEVNAVVAIQVEPLEAEAGDVDMLWLGVGACYPGTGKNLPLNLDNAKHVSFFNSQGELPLLHSVPWPGLSASVLPVAPTLMIMTVNHCFAYCLGQFFARFSLKSAIIIIRVYKKNKTHIQDQDAAIKLRGN